MFRPRHRRTRGEPFPRHVRKLIPVLSLLMATALAGCGSSAAGPERVAVEGTVWLGSEPLKSGLIRFIPEVGTTGPQSSAAVREGKFAVDADSGPVIGKHRVEIVAVDYDALPLDDEAAYARIKSGAERPQLPPQIPARYNRQSILQVEVQADPAPLEFRLDR